MSRAAHALAVLCTAWLCAGCLGYVRTRIDEPLPPSTLERLVEGGSTLAECLADLGAPVHALEYRGDGMALIWTWQDEGDWSFDVSLPVSDSVNVSFDLDLTATDRPGAVLWFGPDLVLERWRQGLLGDLLPTRSRPAPVGQ